MTDYTYPDKGDSLTSQIIDKKEPFEGYWEKSENEVLSHAEKFIDQKDASILDIGCGEGRLFGRFKPYASKITGVEPDEARREKAVEEAESIEIDVDVRSEGFLDADFEEKFDIILCSHVIQHVNTSDLEDLALGLRKNLSEGGLLIITTSHSCSRNDIFMKSYFDNGPVEEEEVSEQEFNSLVINNENILPVHLFTLENLEILLKGFEFRSTRVFHELHSVTLLDYLIFRDKWINLPFLKKRMGRDVMVVAEKK